MNEHTLGEYAWRSGPEERLEALQEKRALIEDLYTEYQEGGRERVGIDPELKEAIAVLLAADFHTEASCWGHPERRDDPQALYAEKSLFPYIDFSGYEPGDGLDAQGKAVGYTWGEVEAACTRMQRDAKDLQDALEMFYKKQETNASDRMIELRYAEGMPAGKLATHGDRLLNQEGEEIAQDRREQDRVIAKAREQWLAFFDFLKEQYEAGIL